MRIIEWQIRHVVRFCNRGTQYYELQALNTPNYANVLDVRAAWSASPRDWRVNFQESRFVANYVLLQVGFALGIEKE